MDKEKAVRIQGIFNWVRFIILVLFLTFVFIGLSKAQPANVNVEEDKTIHVIK